MDFPRVGIHSSRVLDLSRKRQLCRKRNRWNVFHGIQKSRKCDSGRTVKNKEVIHGAKFREEPGKFQDVVARIQRYRGGGEQVQKIPSQTKGRGRMDAPLQRAATEGEQRGRCVAKERCVCVREESVEVGEQKTHEEGICGASQSDFVLENSISDTSENR